MILTNIAVCQIIVKVILLMASLPRFFTIVAPYFITFLESSHLTLKPL